MTSESKFFYSVLAAVFAVAGMFALAPAALADTITVSDNSMWSALSPQPTNADTVNVVNGATLTVNTPNAVAQAVDLGSSDAGGGGGTLAFAANSVLTVGDLIIGQPAAETGSVNMSSSGTLKISGTLTVNNLGAWTADHGTVDFNGTGAQTIPALNYYNLTISGARDGNNVTLADSGTIGIAGTFSPTATFNSGNYIVTGSTVDFNGTGIPGNPALESIPAFNFYNLTISGNKADDPVVLVNGGTIGIAKTLKITAILQNPYYLRTDGNTIEFNGSGAQTIPGGFLYNNVTISGSGVKNLPDRAGFNGNLIINPGATFNVGYNGLNILGNWINNGSFTEDGTVHFVGYQSNDQVIGGTSVTTFPSLDLMKGGKVIIATSPIVTGQLTLNSCLVVTGSNSIILGPQATWARFGPAAYVYGNVQKQFNPGSVETFTFPVGDATYYTPVTVASMNVTHAGSLTANVTPTAHPNMGSWDISTSKYVNRYWTLIPDGGFAAGTYDLTGNFIATDLVGAPNTNSLAVRKFNGTWAAPVSSASDATTATGTGFLGFSDFAIGEAPIIDSTPPVGSLNINSGATATKNTIVTLNLSATDAVGVTAYRIANGTNASTGTEVVIASTLSFNADVPWTIPSVLGSNTVAVQYRDAAGNWSQNYTHSIIVDWQQPFVTIDSVSPNPTNGGTTVTWHANENGAYDVRIGANCETGVEAGSGNYTSSPATVVTPIASALLPVGFDYIWFCVTDLATNVGSVSATVTKDIQPPTGSIMINGGASTATSHNVDLTLSGTDSNKITAYRVANGTDASGGTIVPVTPIDPYNYYDSAVPWTLADGEGTKTVAVQYRDAAGNWSINYTRNILVDSIAPTVTGVDSDGKTFNSASAPSQSIKIIFSESIANWPTVTIGGITQTVSSCTGGFCLLYAVPAGTDYTVETVAISDAKDGPGNVMLPDSNHSFIVDTVAPTIKGLSDDPTPTQTKTWTWDSTDTTAIFRFLIDTNSAGVPAGDFSNTKTTTKSDATGTYYIHVQAKDPAGNIGPVTTVSAILIQDITPPVITVPADIVAEATGADGATVTFNVSATDDVDGAITPTCDPVSGSTFPIGATKITCSATDAHNNTGTNSFNVTVQDTTPPVISGTPSDFTAEATGADGATVTYALPAATDVVDGTDMVSCSPTSDSIFKIGTTEVDCTAKDAAGNAATPTKFNVVISDSVAPVIDSHDPVNAEMTSADGATVIYAAPNAVDAVDGIFAATCLPATGSTFALGETTVTCNATDKAGNAAKTTSFSVKVQDTTLPTITITTPANVSYALNQVVAANYSCGDTGSGIATCVGNVPSGNNIDTASAGVKTFTVNATDKAGNLTKKQITYTVAYNFIGFQAPVDNPPVVNTGKAGRNYPIKWQLEDANGNFTCDLGAVTSEVYRAVSCSVWNADPTDGLPLDAPGASGLSCDGNQFHYNWKTDSSMNGCYQMYITLSDGTTHTAYFKFSK